ncbi:MAG: bifunctional phosphatase PAP2/diacylglycerol kinase family protein [Haloechinothrix sp.]
MAGSAALPATRADRFLKVLSKSANKGMLWWAIGALLATKKGATRRGVLRGVAAIGGASALANLVAKPVFPRRRPAADQVPVHRRLRRHPTSSSFPSGHSASAAAFATAVAMESPAAGLVVAPIAASVAYSRIHCGVHWPSDVAAGMAIGVAAGLGTRHWWPLNPDIPARAAHRADAPAMHDGADLVALVNPQSGQDSGDPTDLVREAWPRATVIHPDDTVDIRQRLEDIIQKRSGSVRAIAVAGGDGTAAAVASVAAEQGLPLALIPSGTLNRFARDVGVASAADARDATETGSAVGIDLAEVEVSNSAQPERRWFVNTAGLGGYPEMVRLREQLESTWPKWPAFVIATLRTLRRSEPLDVLLNGEPTMIWMLFVGNGTYAPKGFAPSRRPALDTGLLDVRYVRADVRYSRLRFFLAVVTNSLSASRVYRQRDLAELDVQLRSGHRRIATDGEVGPLGKRFKFRSRPSALTIYRA